MTISVASFALLLLLLILATCVDSRLNSANDDGTKRRISNKKTPNRRRRRTAKEVTLIFPEPPRQPITSVGSESDYNPVPIQYIVGGMTTKPKRYPYFAALYKVIDGKKYHICGATLIHDDILLTASHCAEHADLVRVGAYTALSADSNNGGHPFHDSAVAAHASHPDFYRDKLQRLHNDFALLRLKTPVTDRYFLDSMLSLDRVEEVEALIENGDISQYVTAIGLGRLQDDGPMPDFLQEVELRYMKNERCSAYFGDVPDHMLCAKESQRDACTGDSGGILIATNEGEDVPIGITSWGSGCASNYPGVYARISQAKDWIEKQICQMSTTKPLFCTEAASRTSSSTCIEKEYCKHSNSMLPKRMWCIMNGNACQVTCGKCGAIEVSTSSSPLV